MDKFKRYYFLVIPFLIFGIVYIALFRNYNFKNIEELNFIAGVGFDIDTSTNTDSYKVPVSVYNFNFDGSVTNYILEARGSSTIDARVDRQLHSGKNFSLGTEKVYILSKNMCTYGISSVLDGLLNNPQVSNRSLVITTSNDPKDLLALQIDGYPSSSDYIAGLIKSLQVNAFTSNNYSLFDAYVKNKSEGSKFIAPNIDLVDNRLSLTSFSVFENGKIVASIPLSLMNELNTLRNDKSHGIFTFTDDKTNFISFTIDCKRDVKCTKEGPNFKFDIYIKAKGKIINNNYMNNLNISLDQKNHLEKRIAENVEISLTYFIDHMKNYYKLDLLNLGNLAASKYGRYTHSNWDEVIVSSPIDLHIDFSIDEFGLGNINF